MRWFELNLQKVLLEAGEGGLRVHNIVRNICNMEPTLFGTEHTYEKTWKEVSYFLRTQSTKPGSPYLQYVDKATGNVKRGYYTIDKKKIASEPQQKLDF